MNINNLAGLCAILGFIAVVIKFLFFSGGKYSYMDASIKELKKDVNKLEEKIEQLLVSVSSLQGELRRMNGRGYS